MAPRPEQDHCATSIKADQAQLFIALQLIKSKPEDMKIRDYLARLRTYLQPYEPQSPAAVRVQFDTVAYLKRLNREQIQAISKAQARIQDLELQVQQMAATIERSKLESQDLQQCIERLQTEKKSIEASENTAQFNPLERHCLSQATSQHNRLLAPIQPLPSPCPNGATANAKRKRDGTPQLARRESEDNVFVVFHRRVMADRAAEQRQRNKDQPKISK